MDAEGAAVAGRTSPAAVDQSPPADLLKLLDELNATIGELSQAIEERAQQDVRVRLLMTHPEGVQSRGWRLCW